MPTGGRLYISWLLTAALAVVLYVLHRLLDLMPVPVLDVLLRNSVAVDVLLLLGHVTGSLYYTSTEQLDWIGG